MAGGLLGVVKRDMRIPPTPEVTPELLAQNSFYIPNIIGQSVLIFVVTSFILAKCIVRRGYLGLWSTEDWLIVLSWAVFIVMTILGFYSVAHGSGMDHWLLDPEQLAFVAYWNNVTTIVYSVEAFLSKSAVLVTYIKIFASGHGNRDWWMIVGMIIANGLFYFITMFLKIFACMPREKIWYGDTPGVCHISQGVILTATSVWNTLSDIAVLALPALFVWRLRLKSETKWQIVGFFFLGAIAYPILSIVGIIMRVIWAYQADDPTHYVGRLYIFAEAEIAAGLICACLPSVSFLIRRLQTRGRSYTDIERRKHGAVTNSQSPGAGGNKAHGGPDTQHLDVVLDDIETEAAGGPGSRRKRWLSRTSMLYGGGSGDHYRRHGEHSHQRSVNGMDIVAELAGDGIWKTTEVSVTYDPRKTPKYRSRANSSERTVVSTSDAMLAQKGAFLGISEARRPS